MPHEIISVRGIRPASTVQCEVTLPQLSKSVPEMEEDMLIS